MHARSAGAGEGDDRRDLASTAGQVASIGLPINFREAGVRAPGGAVLGEQHRECCANNGFSDAEANQMAAEGAIPMPDSIKAEKP